VRVLSLTETSLLVKEFAVFVFFGMCLISKSIAIFWVDYLVIVLVILTRRGSFL
jgi:hypothetical protein